MPKEAVLSLSPIAMWQDLSIKKNYLLFDKIYLDRTAVEYAMGSVPLNDYKDVKHILSNTIRAVDPPIVPKEITGNPDNLSTFLYNTQSFDFLINNGIVELVDWMELLKGQSNITMMNVYENVGLQRAIYDGPFTENVQATWQYRADWQSRALSLILGQDGSKEVTPICQQIPGFTKIGKKHKLLHFVLGKLPEPDDSVSWEQLDDFRLDPSTRSSYYALVKWINETARKDLPFSEIEEEYEYLYHQYANQYRIHKMKQKFGILEVLVAEGFDFFANKLTFGAVKSSFFNIYNKEADLLDAETKFTGREIAYIHQAERKIGQ